MEKTTNRNIFELYSLNKVENWSLKEFQRILLVWFDLQMIDALFVKHKDNQLQ
jgi:hypothetical protein